MNTNLKIIASLAYGHQNTTKNQNKLINIFTSIIQYPYDIDIKNLDKLSEKLSKESSYFNSTQFTIIELDFITLNNELILDRDYLTYIKYNVFYFIKMLFEEKYNLINKHIDGKFETNSLLEIIKNKNVIFILNGINFSNLLFLFRTINISIYGGYNTKRHLLSTVQSSLVKFLLLLNNLDLDPNLIYQSFKDFNTSNVKYDKNPLLITDNDLEINTFIKDFNYLMDRVLTVIDYINSVDNSLYKINSLHREINIDNDKIKDLEKYSSNTYYKKK